MVWSALCEIMFLDFKLSKDKILKFLTPNLHFQCSDWFIQLRLTGHIPSQLKWECIAPIVAELKKAANVQDLMKFDKTINLFALVGYETSYSQRVGYLPSHIQRALME